MKTVIELAEEAGFEKLFEDVGDWVCFTDEIERFAEFVRADEREACAKVCHARYMGDNNREDMEAKRCAAAIRARGNT